MKILPLRAEFFRADEQTEALQDEASSRFSQLCEGA